MESIARTKHTDAHTILTSFILLEIRPDVQNSDDLFGKLADDLIQADFFCAEAPVSSYGLSPIAFAPTSNSYCRRIFSDSQIEAHLLDLEYKQEDDGGWPILWEPPSGAATSEWRAIGTVNALRTLRSYGRV